MAQITNDARYRPYADAVHVMDLDTTGIEYAQNIYDDTYGDHDETVISSRFHSDEGAAPEAIEGNAETLKKAAQENFSRRVPIIDWKTSNDSFIEVHNDLKRLGIKNNTFFLVLYDRSLQGVDPFAKGLPIETQIRIYLECVVNPWYFLREIARIPAQGKPIEPGGGDQYRLDRNNLATWYLFLNHIDTYSSKPRQCGKTQDAMLKVNYSYHFGSSSSSTLLFNKDLALSKENLARLKDQRDLFPTYLQMRVAFDEETGGIVKGIDNITTMKNPVTSNSIKVMPCATSAEMADRLGRGYTAPVLVFDEVDYQNFNIRVIMASVFAYSTASKNAIENGSCAARLFLSTPGDLSTRDGKAMTDYIRGTKEQRGMLVWNDRMYDQPIEEIREIVNSTAYNGIVFVEHSWQQLKRSMEWYERQCNLCSYNQEVILREVNLQRLAGSNLSPFTREQQLYLSSHIRKPKRELDYKTKDTISTMYFYEDLNRKIPYIFGIDPSEGLSGDNNALIVINPYTLCVAAEYKCPYISPKDFTEFICSLMDRFCPRALLVVEANRGRDILQRLTDSPYASRVWYDVDRMNQLLSQKTDEYGGIPQSVIARKVQGFVTGTKSRTYLFGALEEMVNENIDLIYTNELVNEILTLIRKPGHTKIEAAPGEHDDCVMAYLIGLYVYLHASNLEEFGMSRAMRAPDQKEEEKLESIQNYKQRVASAVDELPEEYRGIFEDFLRERNQTTDARDYAREIATAEQFDPFNRRARTSQYDDPTEVQLDRKIVDSRKPAEHIGLPGYKPMGYQHREAVNKEDDTIMPGDYGHDAMSFEEREAYERSIFGLNYGGRGGDPSYLDGGSPMYPGGFDLDDFTDRY